MKLRGQICCKDLSMTVGRKDIDLSGVLFKKKRRGGSGPTNLTSPLPRRTLTHRLASSVAVVGYNCPDRKNIWSCSSRQHPLSHYSWAAPKQHFQCTAEIPMLSSKALLGGFFPSNLISSCSYFSPFGFCLINCSSFEGCIFSKRPGERAEGCDLGKSWVNPTVA